jgi:Ulp1 family protease
MIIHAKDHWQLQWFKVVEGKIKWYFYCPLNRARNEVETNIILSMISELLPEFSLPDDCIDVLGPRQKNGYDCGPYVIMAIMTLLLNKELNDSSFFESDSLSLRKFLLFLHEKKYFHAVNMIKSEKLFSGFFCDEYTDLNKSINFADDSGVVFMEDSSYQSNNSADVFMEPGNNILLVK